MTTGLFNQTFSFDHWWTLTLDDRPGSSRLSLTSRRMFGISSRTTSSRATSPSRRRAATLKPAQPTPSRRVVGSRLRLPGRYACVLLLVLGLVVYWATAPDKTGTRRTLNRAG